MSIRFKIILVVLPVLIASVVLVGVSSYFSASAGISKVARSFLEFKVYELQKYAEGQWQLLTDADHQRQDLVDATKNSVGAFAKTIVRSESELIFAVDQNGNTVQSTGAATLSADESAALMKGLKEKPNTMLTLKVGGKERVLQGFSFAPFGWSYVVSDLRSAFYSDVEEIALQTGVILVASLLLSASLLFFFAASLTRPLRKIVAGMKEIITSGDVSKTVEVEFADETGTLAHTFNIMTAELDKAWKQIKNYALQAVLAQKKEFKLRKIFQKFVPADVISQYEANPEQMLVGRESEVSILFSDIRSFTTISESMSPSDLVQSLNRYFSVMVDLITNRNGVVDKYIGDAIMAIFGAPAKHADDPLQSVLAGIEMNESLQIFNADQTTRGKPHFNIGVGINYGIVTVGNIGTDKKMDYTVIGDNVNLGSRLEGLTKEYHQKLLISESLQEKVRKDLPTRLIDAVAVKGKAKGVRIFTAKRELTGEEKDGWAFSNEAMEHYFDRRFDRAVETFSKAERHMPGDYNIAMIKGECEKFRKVPPPEDWDGVRIMDHK